MELIPYQFLVAEVQELKLNVASLMGLHTNTSFVQDKVDYFEEEVKSKEDSQII